MEITRGQWIIIILLTLSFIATAGFIAFATAAVLSFGPAYLYLKSIRNAEETDKEPWSALQTVFIWGAVSGVFYALILNSLGGSIVFLYSGNDADLTFILNSSGWRSCLSKVSTEIFEKSSDNSWTTTERYIIILRGL